MIICGDRLDFDFSEQIATNLNANIFYSEITTFPDGEMRVSVNNSLVGKEVLLVKLFSSGDFNAEVLKASFIIDALKRAGAKKVIGFLPYFPYVRSDHQKKTGEAVNLEVIARILEVSGLDELITIDPHTVKFPEFFTIPVRVLSALDLFAREIGKNIKNKPFSIVSPDSGGMRMVGPLSEIFHHAGVVVIEKERFADGSVEAVEIEGKVENICVIFDDIIATGRTIAEAIKILQKKGASEFYVFATHGIFSKDTKQNLKFLSKNNLFVTDSIYHEKNETPSTALSVIELLTSHLKNE